MADAAARERAAEIDWAAIERSPEYRELRGMQRRFLGPATVGYLVAYFGFLILAGTSPDLLGSRIYRGFTLGWLLLIGLFVLVWALVFAYVRVANTRWDAQAERATARAVAAGEATKLGVAATSEATSPEAAQSDRTEPAR